MREAMYAIGEGRNQKSNEYRILNGSDRLTRVSQALASGNAS